MQTQTGPSHKVVLMGDAGVGKTSILLRLSQHVFQAITTPTVSSGCTVQHFATTNGPVSLQIWDTAGEERYRFFTRLYSQGAEAVVIVFDVSDPCSFESVPAWIQTVSDSIDTRPVIFIVANKVDLPKRAVSGETVAEFTDRENLTYLEVSAKLGLNVATLFEAVAEAVGQLAGVGSKPLLPANKSCCGG
jgi:small GTP-binding protein